MATFEIKGPDGGTYRIQGADTPEAAMASLQKALGKPEVQGPPQSAYDPTGGRTASGSGVLNTVLKGATFGLSDEVSALGTYVGKALKNFGKSPDQIDLTASDAYNQQLAAERKSTTDFAQANPVTSTALEIGGGLISGTPLKGALSAGAKAAPNLGSRMLTNAGTAGAFGALSGFGSAEGGLGDRLVGAAEGGVLGVGLGAALPLVAKVGGKALGVVGDTLGLRNTEKSAANQLLRAFERDGMTPNDALKTYSNWQAAGAKPEMLFDVGGENVKRLARAIAAVPGEATSKAVGALETRQAGQGTRVADDVAGAISPSRDFYGAKDAVVEARAAAAKPAYEAAYGATPLNPDLIAPGGDLHTLMQRPAMKDAARNALSIASEEGVNPKALGITFNEAGDAVFKEVPSWKTLDYLKRGLDDVLEKYRDPVTGRLALDTAGRAKNSTRAEFLDLLKNENPDYRKALSAYSGPSQSLDAMRTGRDIFRPDAEITAAKVKALAPGDREFFKAGVARAVQDIMAKTPDGADAVKRLIGNPGMRAKLQAAFDNPADYMDFLGKLNREAAMYKNAQFVSPRAGSQTARIGADLGDMGADPAIGILGTLAHGAATQNPASILSAAAGLGKTLYRRGQGINSATADAIASAMFDPAQTTATLGRLGILGAQNAAQQARNAEIARYIYGAGGKLGGGFLVPRINANGQ